MCTHWLMHVHVLITLLMWMWLYPLLCVVNGNVAMTAFWIIMCNTHWTLLNTIARMYTTVMLDFYFNTCLISYVNWKTAKRGVELHNIIYVNSKPEIDFRSSFKSLCIASSLYMYLLLSRVFNKVLFPQLWRPNALMMISLLFSCLLFSWTSVLSSRNLYSFTNDNHSWSALCSIIDCSVHVYTDIDFLVIWTGLVLTLNMLLTSMVAVVSILTGI